MRLRVPGISSIPILPLNDSGQAGGLLFLVMPYVEGESLREKQKREKLLANQEPDEVPMDRVEGRSRIKGIAVGTA
jgi:hypothetical protein